MFQTSPAESCPAPLSSPLVISDRLLELAENADRAGYRYTAERLVRLAYHVFDEASRRNKKAHGTIASRRSPVPSS